VIYVLITVAFYHSRLKAFAFSVLTLLVEWQEGHPACKKTKWWGASVVICLERGADLHMAQLMPLPITVSFFSKIQTGFTFLVPAHLGSPRKGPLNRCVCVYHSRVNLHWPVNISPSNLFLLLSITVCVWIKYINNQWVTPQMLTEACTVTFISQTCQVKQVRSFLL